jgi:hypothetical protein
MNSSIQDNAFSVRARTGLEIRYADDRCEWRDLTASDTLIVGSAECCGIHVMGAGVSALHCWLRFADGELTVQDWNSVDGTFVDDIRIPPAETRILQIGQVLRIGEACITLSQGAPQQNDQVATNDAPSTASTSKEPVPNEPSLNDATLNMSDEFFEHLDTSDVQDSSSQQDTEVRPIAADNVEETQADLPGLDVGASQEKADGVWDPWSGDSGLEETQSDSYAFESIAMDDDAFDRDVMDLLRAEVSRLEGELAERDASIATLSERADHEQPNDSDDASSDDADALFDRFDALLEELTERDRCVSTLEELLQAAEQATEAEREERSQFEAWIGEIERRVSEREAEWRAEEEQLRRKLQEVSTERERAEKLLVRGRGDNQMQQAEQQLLHELRQKTTDLEEQLASSEQSRHRLEQRLASANVEDFERQCQERIEEALREERLQLAEERTEFSRMRAELAREKSQAPALPETPERQPDEMTSRVQTLRQHLREIHEQERQEREERKFSRRIARLWKRLDHQY